MVQLRCGRFGGELGAQEGWRQQWATWLKEPWTSLVRMEDSVQGLSVGSLGASETVKEHWTVQLRWEGAIRRPGSWLRELAEMEWPVVDKQP